MEFFQKMYVPKIFKNQKTIYDWTKFLEKPEAIAIKNALEDSSTSEVHRFLSSRVLKFDRDRGLIILEDYFLDHFNYINFLIELCKFAKIKGMLKLADGDVRDIYRITKYDPSGKM